MNRTGHRNLPRGAALISMVAILVIVAAFAAVFLSVHTARLSIEETAIRRLRAQAAAWSATHLALRRLTHDADLQRALARVVHEQDTSFDSDPLFKFTGTVADAGFVVEVWPGQNAVRLRSRGVCGGVYYECWSQMPIRPQ